MLISLVVYLGFDAAKRILHAMQREETMIKTNLSNSRAYICHKRTCVFIDEHYIAISAAGL